MRRNLTTGIALLLSLFLFAPLASAGDYPDRPLVVFTMVQPGAQIDRLARGIADRLSKALGQPVTVRNITGGSHGSVMATELSKAKPDGYTLAIAAATAYTYQPHHSPVKYRFDDFDFLTLVALNASGFVSHPDKPWNTLQEAFAWAKENDEALVVMFHGSDDRDAIQRMAATEGVRISLIPSKGGPSVIQAVTGGHADIGYVGAILYEHVKAGRLKLIASALSQRLPPLPDVPTLKEQGYDETVEMVVALVAPKGIPADRKAKLEMVLDGIAAEPETEAFITEQLLMLPLEWGNDHADASMQAMYEQFGRQAQSMK